MDYDVLITESAKNDLDELVEYISKKLFNPVAAKKLSKLISEKIQLQKKILVCFLYAVMLF